MSSFRENRNLLLNLYSENLINDEKFCLLFDINTSSNRDFAYWNYEPFDLSEMSHDDCIAEFRFRKHDIPKLVNVLQLPPEIRCTLYNNFKITSTEALCILLKRLAYPCRYSDMIYRFGRAVSQLSMVFNQMLDILDNHFGRLLQDMNQPWFNPHNLQLFADSIYRKGAALDNVWGFIDGTVKPCSRTKLFQRQLYNGHQKTHALKFQQVSAPNGLIANLFGPVEGRRHDCAMLQISGLQDILQRFSHGPNGELLCTYGDPAYPLRRHLQAPFRGKRLAPAQDDFNKSMSKSKVTVEWLFGDILGNFKFVDFKKNLKVGFRALVKYIE